MNLPFSTSNESKSHRLYICLRILLVTFMTLLLLLWWFMSRQYQYSYFIQYVSNYLNKRHSFHIEKNSKSSPNKIIIISHFNENLDWLNLLDNDNISYIVYTRSNNVPSHYRKISINKGREAVVYLRYIVDHYSNLPSSIAFIHAHRTSWHQRDPSDIVVALKAFKWNKYNYAPLTSAMTESIIKPIANNLQATVNYKLWHDVLEKELGPAPEHKITTHCCATFVVQRNVILAHPKIFYSNILNYILASEYSDQLTGRTLEYTWHIIFGQPFRIRYSTCDVFSCDSNRMITVPLTKNT